nr:MAG TPA: hypothetical protein [Caudoviricetes sp.]
MQRLQQAEVVGQHRRNRVSIKIRIRVKAGRICIVDSGQPQSIAHHHRPAHSHTESIQLRRVCTLPCQLCQSNNRLPINGQQFRCGQKVSVCAVKLCADTIADRIINLNVFFGSVLGVVDGLGLLFLVTDECADHRAVRHDGQQIRVALIGALKGQQGVALCIAGCVQQLLAVQALADGVSAGGGEKVLHFVHGFVLSSPLRAKQKNYKHGHLGRVGLVGAGYALHIDPNQAQFAQICLCQQLGNSFNVAGAVYVLVHGVTPSCALAAVADLGGRLGALRQPGRCLQGFHRGFIHSSHKTAITVPCKLAARTLGKCFDLRCRRSVIVAHGFRLSVKDGLNFRLTAAAVSSFAVGVTGTGLFPDLLHTTCRVQRIFPHPFRGRQRVKLDVPDGSCPVAEKIVQALALSQRNKKRLFGNVVRDGAQVGRVCFQLGGHSLIGKMLAKIGHSRLHKFL